MVTPISATAELLWAVVIWSWFLIASMKDATLRRQLVDQQRMRSNEQFPWLSLVLWIPSSAVTLLVMPQVGSPACVNLFLKLEHSVQRFFWDLVQSRGLHCKHFSWHREKCCSSVITAIWSSAFTFIDRDYWYYALVPFLGSIFIVPDPNSDLVQCMHWS